MIDMYKGPRPQRYIREKITHIKEFEVAKYQRMSLNCNFLRKQLSEK
jgi:hypothetical protein